MLVLFLSSGIEQGNLILGDRINAIYLIGFIAVAGAAG